MKGLTYITLIILFSTSAIAGGTIAFSASQAFPGQRGKQLGISYDPYIKESVCPFTLHFETGALPLYDFLDPTYTWYAGLGLGLNLKIPYAYLRASNSLTFVYPRSFSFRTSFQVLSSAGVGLRARGWTVGIAWRHLSNGTRHKNLGHDYYGLEIGKEL